jgi:hypothetical protein
MQVFKLTVTADAVETMTDAQLRYTLKTTLNYARCLEDKIKALEIEVIDLEQELVEVPCEDLTRDGTCECKGSGFICVPETNN